MPALSQFFAAGENLWRRLSSRLLCLVAAQASAESRREAGRNAGPQTWTFTPQRRIEQPWPRWCEPPGLRAGFPTGFPAGTTFTSQRPPPVSRAARVASAFHAAWAGTLRAHATAESTYLVVRLCCSAGQFLELR